VGSGWVSPAAYLGLMAPTWLVMFASFAVWAVAGLRWLFLGRRPQTPGRLLLWLLYGGFGLQLAGALALDQAGAISGNLQLRVFPVVTVTALPLVASALLRLWRKIEGRGARLALAALLSAFLLWSGPASLLKATNDPTLSNYWMFFTRAEERGKAWAEDHLLYRGIWLGLDGIRLGSYAVASGMSGRSGNVSDVWTLGEETRHLLLSTVEESLVPRIGAPVPDVQAENLVYDNGDAALYQRRPRTPYQR